MDDKCWFLVLVVLYACATGNAFRSAIDMINIMDIHAIFVVNAILGVFIAISQFFLCFYAICYYKTWPNEGGGSV